MTADSGKLGASRRETEDVQLEVALRDQLHP